MTPDNDAMRALESLLADVTENELVGFDCAYFIEKYGETIRKALQRVDKVQGVVDALKIIAKRPDLPNPERDADWKNCMKGSAYEAKIALAAFGADDLGVK